MNSVTQKNTFIADMASFARSIEGESQCAWLHSYRQTQLQQFEKATFPHQKIEHFKYNHLDIFAQQQFNRQPDKSQAMAIDERAIANLSENHSVEQLIFVNGVYSGSHSSVKTHRVTEFSDADKGQQEKIINALDKQSIQHNPFIQYNACVTDNGVLIEIDQHSSDAVIEIIHVIGSGVDSASLATQIILDVADNSHATIISRTLNWFIDEARNTFSTHRFVATVGDNATLTHYQLQLENTTALHFGALDYNIGSNTTLNAFHGATGSHLKKIDVTVNHCGEHAHAFLNGLYAATDKQQIDYHTTINHSLSNGQTDEIFRGIVNGEAEATFNGRIHIFEDAQKTRAELSNKNLVLSDTAQIHTKPELEIYADDVVCAHGATVSRMNDESLSYLRARAIPRAEAELMLSYGFFNEVLNDLPNSDVADYLRPILFKRFD